MGTLNKFELKFQELAYYVINITDATVEEKLSILKAMEVFRIVIETIRERKEVKNEMD